MRRTTLMITPLAAGLLATGFTAPAQQPAGTTAGTPSAQITADRPPADALQSYYRQKLDWTACGGGFECAKLTVPLDYDKPDGERIKISVIRLAATGGERIGSVVLNPGGPGGSGVEYARSAADVVSPGVRARFDVVGFDPRGVGGSAPVRCLTGPQLDAYIAADATPDTPAEAKALRQTSRSVARECRRRSARLLPHVGTADAARDMDVLRAALGDAGLTYLGKSYGTYLGAMYADLFPGKVRALVLDGALDPSLSLIEIGEAQILGFEKAYTAFLRDCFTTEDCPFAGRTVARARAETAALLRGADRTPLRNTQDSREITESIAAFGILTPLYDREAWPVLRKALAAAFAGDGTILLRISDIYYGRKADGTYSNQNDANTAINCLDHSYPGTAAAYARAARRAASRSSLFGGYISAESTPCVYWPVKPAAADRPLRAEGAAPIMVVGTLRDPATPYGWSAALASQLSSGVLLSYDGDGHTAYRMGSSCVDRLVDRYLIGGTPPAAGTRCPKV
ncbi:alpha/beta hydrolase [Planomonospora venezuelensis]|uniref:Pimeloyl-ACP methyl ester carboxylesterase n=1 Tax=Planomonospora venezuelensis TaxID=1999 RepID=A0A841DAS6_PLAVE|nr:alpha/beta hydrolase [Planomonospora venezuelensis]MBB5967120.1 pimeloyl-ACP methyl ester carboxylesterase [Planomonospora venezuelensis]GIN04851.1 proteinase [Planomonospora venezuelensis]